MSKQTALNVHHLLTGNNKKYMDKAVKQQHFSSRLFKTFNIEKLLNMGFSVRFVNIQRIFYMHKINSTIKA